MWDKISVFQYQQLEPIILSKTINENYNKVIAIVNGFTLEQVSNMTEMEYYKKFNELNFLTEPLTGSALDYIFINNRKYKCNYNIKDMPCARYIETKSFINDYTNNLHKIAASMIIPLKRKLLSYKESVYDASKHTLYSDDMQQVKLSDIFFSVNKFLSKIKELDDSFQGLYEQTISSESEIIDSSTKAGASKFIQYFGWQYCIKEVANHSNIKINDAYEMPTIEFLNILSYLKAEVDFKKNG